MAIITHPYSTKNSLARIFLTKRESSFNMIMREPMLLIKSLSTWWVKVSVNMLKWPPVSPDLNPIENECVVVYWRQTMATANGNRFKGIPFQICEGNFFLWIRVPPFYSKMLQLFMGASWEAKLKGRRTLLSLINMNLLMI